eukprot:9679916-Karenia_brevis.AAC.1
MAPGLNPQMTMGDHMVDAMATGVPIATCARAHCPSSAPVEADGVSPTASPDARCPSGLVGAECFAVNGDPCLDASQGPCVTAAMCEPASLSLYHALDNAQVVTPQATLWLRSGETARGYDSLYGNY